MENKNIISEMKAEYRYILQPYKGINTRYRCPSCKQNKNFVRYINKETNECLDETFGRCERVNKCGYHKPPVETKYLFVSFDKIEEHKMAYRLKIGEKIYYLPQKIVIELTSNNCYVPEWFLIDSKNIIPHNSNDFKYYLNGSPVINAINIIQREAPKPISYINVDLFKASLKANETNHFVKFLVNMFGVDVASQLVSSYFIGTSKHWNGATVFWQIDTHGKVRTGKIMLYNPTTGKRIKEPFNHVNWVHKALKLADFELRQCLFGEHLLKNNTMPIAIVESEKTAIIASIYFPQFIWVAVGSLQNLNAEKCSILKGRTVFLFPDLNGFEKWSSKAKELSHLATFTVSDLLERKATEAEKKQGLDLADYLIKYNYKAFALPETEATEPTPAVQPLIEVKLIEQPKPVYHFIPIIPKEQPKPDNWEHDIRELENYFSGITLPTQPVKLNNYNTITNCLTFIESHFATLKEYKGNRNFLPYLNRLEELKQVLTINLI